MGYYRRFVALLALSCIAYTSLTVGLAVESVPDSSFESALSNSDDIPVETVPEVPPDSVVIEDDRNVYHIEADTIIIQPFPEAPEDSSEALPDDSEVEDLLLPDDLEEVPEVFPDISPLALDAGNFPFYGSCWVKGSTPDLGKVTLFFPTNYKEGCIGTDNAGRLFNVSNNSWSGVLYVDASGISYTVNFGTFGLPTYRRYSGSSYTNVTLYLTPEDGNILFPDSPSPVYSLADLLPYISILLLGGVFLCSMRKSLH